MSGSQMCPVCDPVPIDVVLGKMPQKSPRLCDACFDRHVQKHREAGGPTQDDAVPSAPVAPTAPSGAA